jgi:hypothetical protein
MEVPPSPIRSAKPRSNRNSIHNHQLSPPPTSPSPSPSYRRSHLRHSSLQSLSIPPSPTPAATSPLKSKPFLYATIHKPFATVPPSSSSALALTLEPTASPTTSPSRAPSTSSTRCEKMLRATLRRDDQSRSRPSSLSVHSRSNSAVSFLDSLRLDDDSDDDGADEDSQSGDERILAVRRQRPGLQAQLFHSQNAASTKSPSAHRARTPSPSPPLRSRPLNPRYQTSPHVMSRSSSPQIQSSTANRPPIESRSRSHSNSEPRSPSHSSEPSKILLSRLQSALSQQPSVPPRPATPSNAHNVPLPTTPMTPPPSPPFDAYSASRLLREKEGYVSFSDVEGLGEPEGPDEHDEEDERGAQWWGSNIWKKVSSVTVTPSKEVKCH